ncbi:MAG: endonuclease I [Sulfurovum sp.]|nr:endonuclease I [Sulfurovum sp.]
MKLSYLLICILLVSTNADADANGNTTFQDFNNATKQLLKKVYSNNNVENTTLYCQASFRDRTITDSNGFHTEKYANRLNKMEWEHIVPAKEFGENIPEWRNKSTISLCTENGFDGRTCAQRLSTNFKLMLSDLYNIYPSIGALNVSRMDYEFIEGDAEISMFSRIKHYSQDEESSSLQFGLCPIIIKNRKVIPPGYSKGIIARTYLYMDSTYSIYRLKYQKKKLFKSWSKAFPVTSNECARTKLIEKIQKNQNKIVRKLCKKSKMW